MLAGLSSRPHHYIAVAQVHVQIQLHMSALSLNQQNSWTEAFHLAKDQVTTLLKSPMLGRKVL